MIDYALYYISAILAMACDGWILVSLRNIHSSAYFILSRLAFALCAVCAIIQIIRGSICLYKDNKDANEIKSKEA